jgi:hypothetical protein
LGAAGAVTGAAIGFAPFVLIAGPTSWLPAISIVVVSTIGLALAYGLSRRWRALAVLLSIVAVPLGYRLLGFKAIPPASFAGLGLLAFLGEIAFLLGTILCALLMREIFGRFDHSAAGTA